MFADIVTVDMIIDVIIAITVVIAAIAGISPC